MLRAPPRRHELLAQRLELWSNRFELGEASDQLKAIYTTEAHR